MLAAPSAKDLARRRQPRVVRRRDGAPEVLEVPGGSRARAPGPVRGLDVDFYRGWRRGHPFLSAVRCVRGLHAPRERKNIGCTDAQQACAPRVPHAPEHECGSAVSNVLLHA